VTDTVPRLRMFAGPNGSGKSTLKGYLPKKLLGIYLNPDEIEQEIRKLGCLDLSQYGVTVDDGDVVSFFRESNFLKSANLVEKSQKLFFQDNRLIFGEVEVNSYFASVAADFIRQILLRNQVSFTIETVMSHPSKVDLLRQAQNSGFRTYLYYIATDDPAINISRVRNRVIMGGHSVPEDLIVKRYYRSLDLLMDAIRYTNRAYVFDNSGQQTDHTWPAEITDGKNLELKSSTIPMWFKRAVLDKATPI